MEYPINNNYARNHPAVQECRDLGLGDADFNVKTAKVMYQAGTEFVRNRFSLSTYDAKEVYYLSLIHI